MTTYNVKLLNKIEIANGTMQFVLEKPEDFDFRAGQFCDLTLIDPPETDTEGNTRALSLVTAPHEHRVAVATRLRDTAFKRVLQSLAEGTVLKFDAPHGDFTLHKTATTPAVFIIGGIGVTPVLSMIGQATHEQTAHAITLIHANKTPDDAPFTANFEALAEANRNFTFVPVYEAEPPDGFTGEQGRVDAAMVRRHVRDLNAPIYYLSGPEGMVNAMRKLLVDELQVNEDNVRTEEFSGY